MRPTPYWCSPAASRNCSFFTRTKALKPRRRRVAPTSKGLTSGSSVSSLRRATSSPVLSACSTAGGASPKARAAVVWASLFKVSGSSLHAARCSSLVPSKPGAVSFGGRLSSFTTSSSTCCLNSCGGGFGVPRFAAKLLPLVLSGKRSFTLRSVSAVRGAGRDEVAAASARPSSPAAPSVWTLRARCLSACPPCACKGGGETAATEAHKASH